MRIALPIFDRITALDAVGPYEVLSRMPDAEVTFLAADGPPGPRRTENGMLALHADAPLEALADPDVIVFPGGFGTRVLTRDERVLDWLRAAHESSLWTTSVCTGSLVLAAAGLLGGLRATTHWMMMDELRGFGAEPTGERVVRQGKLITAAGVSAGIDMALSLAAEIHGPEIARAIQLGIEYDPQPPFDCGSPAKAGAATIALVHRHADRMA